MFANTALAIVLLMAPAHAEIIDRILAVVENSIVTQSDLVAASRLGLEKAPQDADPVAAILDKVMELLDEPATITATGWTIRQVVWRGTSIGADENLLMMGDPAGLDGVATFEFTVWPT